MMQGKSSLNAEAAPYIPISRSSVDAYNEYAKDTMGAYEGSEGASKAPGYQLPDNISIEESLEELQVTDKSCADTTPSYFSDNKTIPAETSAAEKQCMRDDLTEILDELMTRFPGYCAESLVDLLDLNNGDLDSTVYMLEEFEIDSNLETDYNAESSGTSEVRGSSS